MAYDPLHDAFNEGAPNENTGGKLPVVLNLTSIPPPLIYVPPLIGSTATWELVTLWNIELSSQSEAEFEFTTNTLDAIIDNKSFLLFI